MYGHFYPATGFPERLGCYMIFLGWIVISWFGAGLLTAKNYRASRKPPTSTAGPIKALKASDYVAYHKSPQGPQSWATTERVSSTGRAGQKPRPGR